VWRPASAEEPEDGLPDRGREEQLDERLALRNGAGEEADQTEGATRITLRPHDPATVHPGKANPEQTCSTIVEYLPPCGGSMPEPAGGVRRRFGKGLLTGHHFRKQPPGDRSERETVMGMAKGEP